MCGVGIMKVTAAGENTPEISVRYQYEGCYIDEGEEKRALKGIVKHNKHNKHMTVGKCLLICSSSGDD